MNIVDVRCGVITSLRSGKIEAIKIHDLIPRSNEVTHELLLGVVTPVDFSDRPKLRVRTEYEVDAAAGPLELARPAIV